MLFHQKKKPHPTSKATPFVLNLVLFLRSDMAPQATVFLEWVQRSHSATSVDADIFQTLFCETIPRKGEKKSIQRETCPVGFQHLVADNILRGQL